jgi:cystathionine gamma-synthase
MGNPTVRHVERRLARLEGGDDARLFASGMAAITSTFLTCLSADEHLILTRDCYKRTREFALERLRRLGIRVSVVEPTVEAVEDAICDATRMIFTEVPSNPFLCVPDVARLGRLEGSEDITTVVDSTFATPLNLRPLELGVDLVVHSGTKYLGGHHDLVAGALIGKAAAMEPITDLLPTLGGICDPNSAYLLDRGLKTLSLRVERQNASAQRVAEFLEDQALVRRVFYPGLASHPQHETAARLMEGYGGVVTFALKANFAETCRFIDALDLCILAPSLGGTETLIEPVLAMGYWEESQEVRERYGIEEGLLRIALGLEEAEDVIDDLRQGLRRI